MSETLSPFTKERSLEPEPVLSRGTWNYRLVHQYDSILEEHVYAIHSAHYVTGEDKPHSISENPTYPQGATFEEFTKDMAAYQSAYLRSKKDILEYDDF